MKKNLILVLIFLSNISIAQIKTAENNLDEGESIYYYNINFKETLKEKAKYYKIITTNGEVYDYDKKSNLLAFYEKAINVNKSDDSESIYEGNFIFFYKSGGIQLEGNLVNLPEGNLEEGEFKFYTKSGNLYRKSNFIGGYLNGKTIFYTRLGREEGNYKNDKPYGNYTYYSKSNIKVAEGNFDNGINKWIYYNKFGEIVSQGWYEWSKIRKILKAFQ